MPPHQPFPEEPAQNLAGLMKLQSCEQRSDVSEILGLRKIGLFCRAQDEVGGMRSQIRRLAASQTGSFAGYTSLLLYHSVLHILEVMDLGTR